MILSFNFLPHTNLTLYSFVFNFRVEMSDNAAGGSPIVSSSIECIADFRFHEGVLQYLIQLVGRADLIWVNFSAFYDHGAVFTFHARRDLDHSQSIAHLQAQLLVLQTAVQAFATANMHVPDVIASSSQLVVPSNVHSTSSNINRNPVPSTSSGRSEPARVKRPKAYKKRGLSTAVRPHICDRLVAGGSVCGRTFKRAAHLTRHYDTHSNDRNFPCTHCEKSFANIERVQQHHKRCPVLLGKNVTASDSGEIDDSDDSEENV